MQTTGINVEMGDTEFDLASKGRSGDEIDPPSRSPAPLLTGVLHAHQTPQKDAARQTLRLLAATNDNGLYLPYPRDTDG